MADKGNTCSESVDITKAFDPIPTVDGDKKYRYFNQPIEQIPGYQANSPQILVHRPNCGLQWFTLDKCLPVVTCLKLESDSLIAERRSMLIIKDFDAENCTVDATDCPTT